jgi:hypothetical protein
LIIRVFYFYISDRVAAKWLLFREDSIYTKIVTNYLRLIGSTYMAHTIGPIIASIAQQKTSYEVIGFLSLSVSLAVFFFSKFTSAYFLENFLSDRRSRWIRTGQTARRATTRS